MLPNEIVDNIFNEFQASPAKVVKALSVDVFRALLDDLLHRCNTVLLRIAIIDRCSSFRGTLEETKYISKKDFFSYYKQISDFITYAEEKADDDYQYEDDFADSAWAADLSQYFANTTPNDEKGAEAIAKKWAEGAFQTKRPDEVFDIIFNDVQRIPSKVFSAITVQCFYGVLSYCLDRCITESLCSIFENKCLTTEEEFLEQIELSKFREYIYEVVRFTDRANAKGKDLKRTTNEAHSLSRIATITYGIDNSTELCNTFDLIRFGDRIDELFQWFGPDGSKNYYSFIAPYFSLIQSSGTGKTLLLDKYNRLANKKKDTYCALFLCLQNVDSKIHKTLSIEKMKTEGRPNAEATWQYLDSLLPENPKVKKVIFLFDEAQVLLENDAVFFRIIRWWLRVKRTTKKIVAVFAGTTLRLSNYYPEQPLQSKDGRNPQIPYYNPIGDFECYPPFFDLTTMGSLSYAVDQNNVEKNEYERAAFYGRPLFAKLQNDTNKEHGLNDERRYAILERMLFGNINYKRNGTALMNILGTRVQMGFVSFNLASRLVSNAYAHVVSVRLKSSLNAFQKIKKSTDEDIAHICYLPDPVCAQLAMCLMDENWNRKEISGLAPSFWTNAAEQLFLSGICNPSKGDVGEVATALYLLFCGDLLRQSIDSNYMHFSIDLASYVDQLLACSSRDTNFKSTPKPSNSKEKYTVNFIQIVRQYIEIPLEVLCGQETLQWMYNSACALYLPSFTEVFDILASIKCVDEVGKTLFIPLAITVKSQRSYSNSSVIEELDLMKNEASERGLQNGLCLLVLLDVKNNPLNNDTELNQSDVAINLREKIVYKAIAIRDDSFGINTLVHNTRGVFDDLLSEVYSSHAMLSSLPDSYWKGKPSPYSQEIWQYGERAAKPKQIEK